MKGARPARSLTAQLAQIADRLAFSFAKADGSGSTQMPVQPSFSNSSVLEYRVPS
jgi:hypothetical protein